MILLCKLILSIGGVSSGMVYTTKFHRLNMHLRGVYFQNTFPKKKLHNVCYPLYVMCHVLHIMCHMSHVTKKQKAKPFFWEKSGGASWSRVCYQRAYTV